MDLDARLDDYQVTAVPSRRVLHLVWSVARSQDAPSTPGAVSDDRPTEGEAGAALAILADYRITRVPRRAAS